MSNEMTSTSPTSRVPAGVPTGGQFAASSKAESAVTLDTGATVGPDFAARFRPQIDAVEKRWRDEADTEDVFNTQIADLAQQMLDASEDDRPGYTKLDEALTWFRGQMADPNADADDVAEEVIYCMQDMTEPSNMDHDDDDHDALHSAAESWAADLNAAGRAEQVAFLRRMRVSDEQMLDAIKDADDSDSALDDLVIDVASQAASQAYNDGESDGSKVTEALEGKRWLLSGSRTLVDKRAIALADGECTDIRIGADGGPVTFRVSYAEWIPNGDDNTPARDYLRGEFSAETEWEQFEAPLARESSPFRPAKGERHMTKAYAYDQFVLSLRDAAAKAARQRNNDPLRSFIDGTD